MRNGIVGLGMMTLAAMAPPAMAQTAAETVAEIAARIEAAIADDDAARGFVRNLQRQLDRRGVEWHSRIYIRRLSELSPDGRVTPEQIEIGRLSAVARARAGRLASFLRTDLDGDGDLTAEERNAAFGASRQALEGLFAFGDTDGNGTLSFAEMTAYVESQLNVDPLAHRDRYLMLLDADQDGVLAAEDIVASLNALSATPMMDPSGLPLEQWTAEEIANSPGGRALSGRSAECLAPRPTTGQRFIVLSGYEGSALSSVSIAGLDDSTQVAQVHIEAGAHPLFVLLTTHTNVIWEVTGAVDRVEALVVQGRRGAQGAQAGVTGVDADRIHFVEGTTCMANIHDLQDAEAALAYRRVERRLGRAPDLMLADYTIRQVSLPSGEALTEGGEGRDIVIYDGRRYELTPNGPRALDETEGQLPDAYPDGATETLRSLLRFHPDGLRMIRAEDVVSPGPAVEYDVLPQEAGLLQLLLEGRARYSRDRYYHIVEPIERFPAGLNGAHSVRFVLGAGIEMPAGGPGHSSVYSAETGECLTRSCR